MLLVTLPEHNLVDPNMAVSSLSDKDSLVFSERSCSESTIFNNVDTVDLNSASISFIISFAAFLLLTKREYSLAIPSQI